MTTFQLAAVGLILCAQIIHMSSGLHIPVPQPAHGKVHLCSTKQCLDGALQECQADNGLFITMLVHSFARDPYVPLYLGWLQYLFSGTGGGGGAAGEMHGGARAGAAQADDDAQPGAKSHTEGQSPQRQHFVLIEPGVFLSPSRLLQIENELAFKHAAQQGVTGDSSYVIDIMKVYYSAIMLFCVPELHNAPFPWIFIALQHGSSSCTIHSLATMRENNPHLPIELPRVLVHLNHEKPWETNPGAQDFTFPTADGIRNAYALFPLVMRNYYYSELATATAPVEAATPAADVPQVSQEIDENVRSSESKTTATSPFPTRTLFFPLGPSYYGHLVGNGTEPAQIPASQRTTSCYFSGRKVYSASAGKMKQEKSEPACSRTETGTEANMDSARFQKRPYEFQRSDMFRLLEQQKEPSKEGTERQERTGLASCAVNAQDDVPNAGEQQNYVSYLHTMSNVVFALCPAGNTPETFRIYEAMERGAIPILIRSAEADKDFLRSEMWGGQANANGCSWKRYKVDESQEDHGKEETNSAFDSATGRKHKQNANRHQMGDNCEAYPGPVFDTWEEADRYLVQWAVPSPLAYDTEEDLQLALTSRAADLDEIQSEVMTWYTNMKRRAVVSVENAVRTVFS